MFYKKLLICLQNGDVLDIYKLVENKSKQLNILESIKTRLTTFGKNIIKLEPLLINKGQVDLTQLILKPNNKFNNN